MLVPRGCEHGKVGTPPPRKMVKLEWGILVTLHFSPNLGYEIE